MRRDSAYQETLKALLLFVLIIGYGALTDMVYYLPPFFGVAFFLFCTFLDRKQWLYLLPIVVFLLFFEATKNFLLFSSMIFFALSYYLLLPKVRQLFGTRKHLIPLFVFYAYGGYYLFLSLLGALFELDMPDFSLILFYYAAVEMFFLLVLL